MHLVHRLVLASFTDALPSYVWEANHKDGNKGNNALENLEYTTHAENVAHHHQNSQKSRGKAVLGRPVGGTDWKAFLSLTAAAHHARVHTTSVSMVCRGKLKTTGGWEFQYAYERDSSNLLGEEWADVVLELPHHSAKTSP
eukprot:5273700-Amphidinium_carterae.1